MGNALSFRSNTETTLPGHKSVHDVEATRKVQQLIRANHATYAVLYHNRIFHNHMPHLLGSAYLLGANATQLVELYESESQELDKWEEDSPDEVTEDDWRNFYGHKEYQRGYRDYFDDEVVRASYDWKKIVMRYLLKDNTKLLNGLVCGVLHPLIHMAYAFELDSAEIATEALTMAATNYTPYAKFVDEYVSKYEGLTHPSTTKYLEKDPIAILHSIRDDDDFNRLDIKNANIINLSKLFSDFEQELPRFIYRLDISGDLNNVMHKLFHTASLLLTATHKTGDYQFDFALLHALTGAHAAFVLLPHFTQRHRVSVIASLWIYIVASYINMQRPSIDVQRVLNYNGVAEESRNWEYVVNLALNGDMKDDAHYIKAIRALKTLDDTYHDDIYLKQALLFATEAHSDWVFGTQDETKTLDIKVL
ncbi:hypothetical protein V1512DRAFT_248691 [Lipomyces arxii]|uniref:uncharacterized protein n=1 Tax=Lipomyces arxii TaxID=56418 RepID=UPI0034CDD412